MRGIVFGLAGFLSLAAPALTHACRADDALSLPQPGTWEVRLRALAVMPDTHADVAPIGGNVRIGMQVVPEVDATYYIDSHWAIEAIAGTTRNAVEHIYPNLKLGDVWLLPPTVTAQYHFDAIGPFLPYVGAGINYTFFYGVHNPPGLHLDYGNNFGWALQAGTDIPFGDSGYYLNIDAKKIFLTTTANINYGAIMAHTNVNPWLAGFGVGLRL